MLEGKMWWHTLPLAAVFSASSYLRVLSVTNGLCCTGLAPLWVVLAVTKGIPSQVGKKGIDVGCDCDNNFGTFTGHVDVGAAVVHTRIMATSSGN